MSDHSNHRTVDFYTSIPEDQARLELLAATGALTSTQIEQLVGFAKDLRAGREPGSLARPFHEKLADVMKKQRLSQLNVAAMTGVSQTRISRLLSGVVSPTFEIVDELERGLGLEPQALWSDKMHSGDFARRREAEKTKDTWGSRIRKVRLAKGWTILQLANAVGLSTSMISLIERDDREPRLDHLTKIAEALGVFNMEELQPDHEKANG